MTHRKLLLFKWLMIVMPPVTVAVGHVLVMMRANLIRHNAGGVEVTLLGSLLVTCLALLLAYLFVERLFRTLHSLQAEATAREQDIVTMNAVLQERERLGRELHDGAAQLVAYMLLRMDTIRELVAADRKQDAEAELDRLRVVGDEIFKDIAESITGIRTNVTERGLLRTLRDYADQYEERHQIRVSLRIDDTVDQIPPLTAFQIFRLIQEALTNVRKHSGAQEATVTLRHKEPDEFTVIIADGGQGFVPDSPGTGKARSFGIRNMRERVDALGGTFHVHSEPGLGTQVTAILSIPRTGNRRVNRHATAATPTG
jgi:signal transduction histidine kinase